MIKDEYKSILALKKLGLHSNPGDEAFGLPLSKKNKIGSKEKARRAYIRGFKVGFGNIIFGSTVGLSDDDMVLFNLGEKEGKAERKKFSGEIPVAFTTNFYQERKPNNEFEKLVKGVMKSYLKKFD